jgi:ATP synthase F1 complex assembly factor 2
MRAAAKRVYEKVAVRAAAASEGFIVTLDGRELKTPAKRVLTLPTHALASAVALEWEAQDSHIRPATMPLMKLATTTIDQVEEIRPTMTDSMLRCLEADLTCFRTPDEPDLLAKEEAAFAPLITWAKEELALPLSVSEEMTLNHPTATLPRAKQLLADADDWHIAALDQATNTSKSLVIALALAHGRIGAAAAVEAARVAEQHQIDEWGEVEAGHDLDRADIAVRLGAASAFLRLLGK